MRAAQHSEKKVDCESTTKKEEKSNWSVISTRR
jgi:hypothetical protein